MRTSVENLTLSKRLLESALRSIPPIKKFILAFLEKDFLSFLTIFDTSPKIVNWPISAPLADRLSLDVLLNDCANIDILIDLIGEAAPTGDVSEVTSVSLSLWSPSDRAISHFVLFSPHSFQSEKHILTTWVSPVPVLARAPFDGFVLAPDLTADLEMQVQILIQRIVTAEFAVDLRIATFLPKYMHIDPASLSKHFITPGFSQRFSVTFHRTLRPFTIVPIEFAASYTAVTFSGPAVSRTVVFSRVFPATREVIPILRSVDPATAVSGVADLPALIRRLLDLYRRLLFPVLPGSVPADPFFSLLPNLQGFLAVLLSPYRPKRDGFQTGAGEAHVAPVATVWDTRGARAGGRYCCLLTARALGPIVVVDSFDRIAVYADGLPGAGELPAEIGRIVRGRFPVPAIRIFPRARVRDILEANAEAAERLRGLFA
jgi:hypothetical protein